MFRKAMIVGALFAGFFMAWSTLPAQAENCSKTVRKAENNLRKEVLKHGEFSPQARYRRHQLEVARQRCGQSANFRDNDGDRHHQHHDRDRDHDGNHDRP